MIPILITPRCALFHGDSSELGQVLEANTVDSIVTDPPSGISFMGKEWDKDKGGRDAWIQWLAAVIAPAFQALKPGGFGLFWALPRTSHWTAMALELAGFEIRDVHHHIFGTGFPKSLTSKSAPIPEWAGTALKPAVEHWILVRKPLAGTVAANLTAHGTGILNIDGCRVGTDDTRSPTGRRPDNGWGMESGMVAGSACGRWPAHLSFDEHAAELLDEQSDDTEPAKFFYVAKPSRAEKDAGLDHLPIKTGGEATGRKDGSAGVQNPRAGAGRTGGSRNYHPTPKSIALMRWLTRLITPPGGLVLDLFAGSGTTGVAALAEGFEFLGVELTDEYIPIIRGRLQWALDHGL